MVRDRCRMVRETWLMVYNEVIVAHAEWSVAYNEVIVVQ